ncbi:MAG: MFS transporter [Deltaproteobacteria bacterium]|nr:MAG: MFS transporter [Deltaproteobacteria bacterium]
MTTQPRAAAQVRTRRELSRSGAVVLVGCAVCQMGLGMSYVFTTFLKPIVADFGWTRTAFSGAVGPLLLSMSLASPLIGALTDRFGARAVLSVSTLLLSAALFLFSQMSDLWHFYAISILLGLSLTGLGDIPVGSVAARWFSGGRGLALGIVYVGSNVGGFAVPIAATAIAAGTSWRAALVVLGVLASLVILPFALLAVRNPPAELDARSPRAPSGAEAFEGPSLDLSEALRTRSFWLLAVALFGFYFYYLGVLNHLIAFLSDSGFSDAAAARRFGGAVAVGIAGKLAIGVVADRLSTRGALILNFAALTAGSFLLLVIDAPGALVTFLALHGFTVAAENVLLPLVVADAFGVRHMARIYGALMVALLPGGALGPLFAGYVFDTTGSYAPAFLTFALANVVTLVLFALVRRERPRVAPWDRPETGARDPAVGSGADGSRDRPHPIGGES